MNKYKLFLAAVLVLGLFVSIYLTYVHYNAKALVCPTGGLIDCETVLNSAYATIFGVPIAAISVVWFIIAIADLLKWNRKLHGLLGLIAVGALAYSFTTMNVLGKICIWCLSIDITLIIYLSFVIEFSKRFK